MYQEFFGLNCQPFENTNNSNFFYPNEAHKEALAALLYGVKTAKGLVLLTGEIGAGKTQVAQVLKEMLHKDINNLVCEVSNPKLSSNELLLWLATKVELNQQPSTGSNDLFEALNNTLVARSSSNSNFRFVIIFDEAQLLSQDILEKIRLLSNLESNFKKLVQIILIGQPELKINLDQYINRPLMQRISIHKNINYFDDENTRNYVQFRLNKSGSANNPFSQDGLRKIYLASKGSPRLINLICDNCLFLGYSSGQTKLSVELVNQALSEIPGGIFNPTLSSDSDKQNESFKEENVGNRINLSNDSAVQEKQATTKSNISNNNEEDDESNSSLDNERMFSIPTLTVKKQSENLFEQSWVKALALLVAIFMLLWIYSFIQSFFNDPADDYEKYVPPKSIANMSAVSSVIKKQEENKLINNSKSEPVNDIQVSQIESRNEPVSKHAADNILVDSSKSLNQNSEYGTERIVRNPIVQQQAKQLQKDSLVGRETLKAKVTLDSYHKISFPFILNGTVFDHEMVKEGYSISKLAYNNYGIWNTSIEDIVRQANPTLRELSKVEAGFKLKLPRLAKSDLYTQTHEGLIYVYFGTYLNENNASEDANQLAINAVPVTTQNSLWQNTPIVRIYLGPFESNRQARELVDNIRFELLGLAH